MNPKRVSDPDVWLSALPDPTWVVCPRCARPAKIVRKPHRYRSAADATLTCGHCAFRHESGEIFRALNSDAVSLTTWHPRCQKCGGDRFDLSHASVTRHSSKIMVRAHCQGCGETNQFEGKGAGQEVRERHDRWFGLPLVLQASYGSKLIWAYNTHHVDLLQEWLEADLRERSLSPHCMTMMARLPKWMKASHARPKVLRALRKLREIAEAENLS